jgi:hypothetical protein
MYHLLLYIEDYRSIDIFNKKIIFWITYIFKTLDVDVKASDTFLIEIMNRV